jgi:hypothetical protein
MPHVAALYRYPVKGFTPEACDTSTVLDEVLGGLETTPVRPWRRADPHAVAMVRRRVVQKAGSGKPVEIGVDIWFGGGALIFSRGPCWSVRDIPAVFSRQVIRVVSSGYCSVERLSLLRATS